MNSKTYIWLVVLLIIPICATAGGMHDKFGNKFLHLFDENKDGKVSLAEFKIASQSRFTRMDSDNNQQISQEEFMAHVKQQRVEHKAKRFSTMDTNGDMHVSQEEYLTAKRERAMAKFAQIDANNDARLDQEEYIDAKRKRGFGKGKDQRNKRMFDKLDQNEDGIVTKAESLAAWANWFNTLDTNHDGNVTQDEANQRMQTW